MDAVASRSRWRQRWFTDWLCVGAMIALATLTPGCQGQADEATCRRQADEAACQGQADEAACSPRPKASKFVVLPDTQFYSCAFPEIFSSQTSWVAENAESEGIGIVLHTGDIVDGDLSSQWDVASAALHKLDSKVPYMLATGNHDINTARASQIDAYFTVDDLSLEGCAEFRAMADDSVVNAYAIVELAGAPWLFLGIEFAPRDSTLEWANSILMTHSSMPAVIFTHAYLFDDTDRYDRSIEPLQPYHPDLYAVTPSEGIADGQDIWEALVLPNENVKLVLSGHVVPDGIARRVARRPSGTVVHEVLTNFQMCEFCPCEEVSGGDGYLRLIRVDESQESLHVTTYSPYLDKNLVGPGYSFTLEL